MGRPQAAPYAQAEMHAHPSAPQAEAPYVYSDGQGGGAVPPAGPTSQGVSIVSLAGAAMTIGLVVAAGLWGYDVAMRDVSGVPVVRALEGPMRVQPEDPGGLAAQHQGLAVNEVAAEGEAAAAADTLTLAPQAATLAEEDTPVDPSASMAVEAAPLDTAPVPDLATASDLAVAAALNVDGSEDDRAAAALALADAVAEGVAPLSALEPVTEAAPTPAPVETVVATRIPTSVPGVKTSPRPTRRPAGLAATAVESVSARAAGSPSTAPLAASATVAEIDPTSLAVGTRLVQLGAFDSPEIARSEWGKLADRFEDYFGDKARVIEEAQSGGKTFYRLRAHGFADLADARRFCSVLVAAKSACIPVVTR